MNITPLQDDVWDARDSADRLSNFFIAVRRHWKLVACVWALCVTIAIGLAYLLPSYWRAEIVVMPATRNNGVNIGSALGGSLGSLGSLAGMLGNPSAGQDEAAAVLRSREIFDFYATQKDLLPTLYDDRWDPVSKSWTVTGSSIPTLRRAYKLFDTKIRDVEIDRRTNIITLSITWKDRFLAVQWARDLIALTNQQMRTNALNTARRNMDYLASEIRKASASSAQNTLTEALSTSYERELQNYMFAQGQPDFAFRIIDAPTVPDERERVSPKRVIFAAIGCLAGLLLGALMALGAEALRNRRA